MARETDIHNDTRTHSSAERAQQILKDADLCVKCGLCLAHCPTYLRSQDEGDSPRGRIALAQGLAAGRLSPTARVQAHLSGCLVCRACETACPSAVPYARLIDAARAEMAVRRPPHLFHRLLRWTAAEGVVRHEQMIAFGVRSVAALRNALAGRMPARLTSGNRTALWRALDYLPQLAGHQARQPFYPAAGAQRGRVALFLGCVARHLDQQTASAAVHLLTQWGYEVHVPPTQACCGALYVHDGAPEAAQRLLLANLEAFARHEVQAVVTTATGCAATLLEYPRLARADPALRTAASRLAEKVVDISRFLAGEPWPRGVSLAPRPARVAVHEPCTLRHAMAPAPGVCDLLRRIPELDVVRLPAALSCCGAAGTNMLTHPATADALAFDTLDVVAEIGADSLVTSNIGCALHLAAALRARGRDTEVLHAARFLSRQLVGSPG